MMHVVVVLRSLLRNRWAFVPVFMLAAVVTAAVLVLRQPPLLVLSILLRYSRQHFRGFHISNSVMFVRTYLKN